MNIFIKPDRLFGLQAGGSVYHDKVTLTARPYDEWITSGHIVWTKENPEIIDRLDVLLSQASEEERLEAEARATVWADQYPVDAPVVTPTGEIPTEP